ncbi:MAG TPA: hypothetical protein VMB20_12685 [Candidatus Acidoferrum sp.]|nr:hypothetical protein [Candidatus Acidoferrum sp.]
MPFLALVHLRERRCADCNALLGEAGARSFVIDQRGDPVNFSQDEPPEEMQAVLVCQNGHSTTLRVPDDLGAEETLATPDGAPIGRDAMIVA